MTKQKQEKYSIKKQLIYIVIVAYVFTVVKAIITFKNLGY